MMLLLALLLGGAPVDEDPAFVDGKRLYQASEYEQAIFRLQEAALVNDRAPPERARVLMWLGLAYAGFGDGVAARRAFRDAVSLDEAVEIPVEISPKVEADLLAVRAEVAAERKQAATSMSAPAPAVEPPTGDGVAWELAAGMGALGALCVAGGSVASGFAVVNDGVVNDLETFQDDAAKAQDARDAQVGVAVVLYGVGALLLGVTGVVVVAGLSE